MSFGGRAPPRSSPDFLAVAGGKKVKIEDKRGKRESKERGRGKGKRGKKR